MAWVSGIWKWHFRADKLPEVGYQITADVNFKSNGQEFHRLSVFNSVANMRPIGVEYDNFEVRSLSTDQDENGDWYTEADFNEDYSMMDFGASEQWVDDEIYGVIVANAQPYKLIIADMVETIAENEQKVFEAGKKAEYDAFWDNYQDNGNRRNYSKGFCGKGWTDKTFKPKYDIIVVGSGNDFFPSTLITDVVATLEACGVIIDLSECTHLSWGMSGMRNTRLPILNTPKVTTFANCFNADSKLHTIEKIILNEQGNAIFTSAFAGCTALENITFEGVIGQDIDFKSCTKLSQNSITNIINHLSDTASGKTLTLSKTAVDIAFEFVTEINGEGYISKGSDEDNPYWWNLVATKPNWQISLV